MQHRVSYTFIVMFLILALSQVVNSQAISSPYQIALGGGVSYTHGTSAHFYNPANLMIRTHRQSIQITMGLGSIYNSNGMDIDRLDRFSDQLQPYFMPEDLPRNGTLTESELRNMFGGNDLYRQTRSYDIIPAGVSWIRGSSARSVAFRSRGVSSFEMNRNWYKADVGPENTEEPFVRFVNENYQVLHELSFGFAREVTMLNRWQSGLSTLLIGLAPKAVFGGMNSEVRFRSEYHPDGSRWQNTKQLEVQSSGDMDRFITDMLISGEVDQAFHNHLNRNSNMDINGYGAGLDAGMTYIIPLGNDISLSPHIQEPLRRSLRFSIAITDIGMVLFHNHPGKWDSRTVIRSYDELPRSTTPFDGRPGELIHYLHADPGEQSVFENLIESDGSPYFVQLPTKLHLGTAVQYDWFASILDLSYRFNPSEFSEDGWRASIGTEIRLLRFFPLQGSIQLEPDFSPSFGMGAGIDFGFLQLSAAIRMLHRNANNGQDRWYADTVSALGLKMRF